MHNNIIAIFPTPIYTVKRDSDLIPREEKEIEKIIIVGGVLTMNKNNSMML